MNQQLTPDAYGVLTEPATLTIQRFLPGRIERVWAYLTEGDLRRKWLASGHMEMKVGAPFEFVWRNNELTDPPGRRPPGFDEEHRMESRTRRANSPSPGERAAATFRFYSSRGAIGCCSPLSIAACPTAECSLASAPAGTRISTCWSPG